MFFPLNLRLHTDEHSSYEYIANLLKQIDGNSYCFGATLDYLKSHNDKSKEDLFIDLRSDADIQFNYLGKCLSADSDLINISKDNETYSSSIDKSNHRPVKLLINMYFNKMHNLILDITYSAQQYSNETIENLVNNISKTVAEVFENINNADKEKSYSNTTASNNIILMNRSSLEKTILCIHPISGFINSYWLLAEKLNDFTFYGVSNNQILLEKFISVSDLAKNYLNSFVNLNGSVPDYIFGWSFGGAVAYEASKICEERYKRNVTLLMIDPVVPNGDYSISYSKLEENIKRFLKINSCDGFSLDWEGWFKLSMKEQINFISNTVKSLSNKNDLFQEFLDLFLPHINNLNALEAYVPVGAVKKINIVSAKETIKTKDPKNYWGKHTRENIFYKSIEGDHYSILKVGYIDELINVLRSNILMPNKNHEVVS